MYTSKTHMVVIRTCHGLIHPWVLNGLREIDYDIICNLHIHGMLMTRLADIMEQGIGQVFSTASPCHSDPNLVTH